MAPHEHPYTEAFDAGDYVFISGALSVDVDGTPVPGRQQSVDAALATLKRRLATAGIGLEHVVRTVYYTTDVSLRDEANTQFFNKFEEPRPARTFVAVSALPYGCQVEIEAVAAKRPVRSAPLPFAAHD